MSVGTKPPVVARRKQPSLLPYLWIPAVTLAVGFAGGLVLSGLTASRFGAEAAVPDTLVTDPRASDLAQDDLATEPEDWGYLTQLRDRFGPRSPFFRFGQSLIDQGAWPGPVMPVWLDCSAPEQPGPSAAFLDLTCRDAGAPLKAAIYCDESGVHVAKVMVGWCYTGADAAASHRVLERQVIAVGRALRMSEEELGRLQKVAQVAMIPDRVPEEILDTFLPRMPRPIAVSFRNALQRGEASRDVTQMAPAVGFPLGKRWLADVAFFAAEEVPGMAWNYLRFGEPCYSIILHAPNEDYTEGGRNPWPRLTVQEVDALPESRL